MPKNEKASYLAGTIAEHVRPFAEMWTDGRGGLVALPAGRCRDAALVVRTDARPSVFRDAAGKVRAVAGRGWALARTIPTMRPYPHADVAFAGTVRGREVPHIVAALRELGAKRVEVTVDRTARFFAAVLGEGAVQRRPVPNGPARALVRAAREVCTVWDSPVPRTGTTRGVSLDVATANVRRIDAWGSPPPVAGGTALAAYATLVVHRRPWELRTAGIDTGTREDLVHAIRAWSRELPTVRGVGPDGRAFEVRTFPCGHALARYGIRAVAFPAGDGARKNAAIDGLVVAPHGDFAVVADDRPRARSFLGRRSLGVLYAGLTRHLLSSPWYRTPVAIAMLAIDLAMAVPYEEGATVVVDGVLGGLPTPFDYRPLPA